MLPKVTSMASEIETYSLNFEQVIEFCLRRHSKMQNQIDPFDPQNLVLLPMVYKVIEDELQIPTPLLSTVFSEKHNTILIELKNIQLVNNEKKELPINNVEYSIMFQECVQEVLPNGWSCASQERVKEFFSQKQNQLYIRTFANQYNTSTKQIELIEEDYYAIFDNKTTYYSQLTILTSNVSVDTGFLFESITLHEFPSQIKQYVQQMDLDYFTHIYNKNVYIVFEIELGTVQQTVFIEYPKISEVLANIGSIISFFLLFSNFAYLINERTLEDEVEKTVIEMYYPQIKEIKFIKNWYQKLVDIKYKNKSIAIGQFLAKYHDLKAVARQKLCLTNSLYEISRLQFALETLCNREVILRCHKKGIPLKELDRQDSEKSEIIPINNQPEGLQVDNIEDRSLGEINIGKIVMLLVKFRFLNL